MGHERFLTAARRFLGGDDSLPAANELECVVLEEYGDDERFDALGEALALYAPGQASPYSTADEVRVLIQQTVDSIA